ncbi:hypothetical protein KQH97_08545 [Ruminococcus sp. MSJ-25]|uniref:hypothetical protein n=1 Tax=Ruminococcus sp. MSJ-25 TaxID=2841536 RepID=UPI001C1159B6|nr:hypothetical protein [Ruminococcus sp. MSJ-25]MBU5408346.1 hypothetical protein [Ruminococcus sp. MSJ-25]
MTKADIDIFIEEMEAINDKWTPEQVERVYGSMSLEDALSDRKASLKIFFDIVGKVVNNSQE